MLKGLRSAEGAVGHGVLRMLSAASKWSVLKISVGLIYSKILQTPDP